MQVVKIIANKFDRVYQWCYIGIVFNITRHCSTIWNREIIMIKSLIKAINILNLFNTDEPRLTLNEISKRLDIPKSTAQ